MMALVYGGIIWGVWKSGLYVIRSFEQSEWMMQEKEQLLYCGCSGIIAVIVTQLFYVDEMAKLCMALVAGSLLLACITDRKNFEVYRFVWWISGAAGCLLVLGKMVKTGGIDSAGLWELVLFITIQEKLFSKLYGKADCHAFVVCSLIGYGIGMGLWNYLIHMLYAVCALAIVQFGRRNVNRKGNLKRPVAFLPYITVSFWINICCFSLGKMVY